MPAPLGWIIDRCLAKDPRQRYESTTDLARELRTLRDRLSEFSTANDAPSPASSRSRLFLAAAIAAAAAVGVLAGRLGGASGQPLDRYRFTPFATDAGYQSSPVWSPDGQDPRLRRRRGWRAAGFCEGDRIPAARAGDTDQVRLSGSVLVPGRNALVLRIARTRSLRTLVHFHRRRRSRSRDGKRPSWRDLARRESPGTHARVGQRLRRREHAVVVDAAGQRADPIHAWIVRGSQILRKQAQLLTRWLEDRSDDAEFRRPEFWVIPLGDENPRLVSSRPDLPNFAAPFSWLPDSRHIVSAMPVPRPGVHLWLTDTTSSDASLITASGSVENDPAVSPDGTRLATDFQQANYDIYQLSLDRPALLPVIATARNEMDPAWSAAGSQLAYTTDRSGTDEIWLRSQNGEFERPLVTALDFREHRHTS